MHAPLFRQFDPAEVGLADGPDAGQAQYPTRESAYAERGKDKSVSKGRHSHRDDNACRLAFEFARRISCRAAVEPKAAASHFFQKALKHRGRRTEPKRMDENQMLGPADIILCLSNVGCARKDLKVFEANEQRKGELADIDAAHFMPGFDRRIDIRRDDRGTETLRPVIRVSVDYDDAFGHGVKPYKNASIRRHAAI